jgi:hypothetical protein
MTDEAARREWVEHAAETLRHGGWSVTSNVIDWLEQYYDERPLAVKQRDLIEREFKDILHRLLSHFPIKNGSSASS